MADQYPRRAVEDDSASNADVRPVRPQLPTKSPRISFEGLKTYLKMRADTILDWYAAQPKSLRVGLLGGAVAFGLMGAVAAASNALAPLPTGSSWANVPSSTPATSMAVRVSGSAGPVASSAEASTAEPTTTQMPAVSEQNATSATSATTGYQRPTATAAQKTTSATQAPVRATAAPTTASPTTAAPTSAAPTTVAPSTAPPTTAPPTTAPPTTAPPTTAPPTTAPTA